MIIPKTTRKQVVNRLTLSGNTIQIQYKTHIRKKKKKHDNYEKHKTGVEHTQSAGKYNTDTKHKHKKIEKRKKHDNCEKHKNRWCTDTQYKTHPSENTEEENMKTNSLEKNVKNTDRKLMSLFFVFLFTFFPSICIFVFVYFCLILL